MTKSDLIAALQAIPGNPHVVVPGYDHSYRRRFTVSAGTAIYDRDSNILSEDDPRLELEAGERRIPIVVIE
jgi:hypothetical protein